MELRVSDNGEKFADIFIPTDVALFAEGDGYAWVLGPGYGVRADLVSEGCANPFCEYDAPTWRFQLFERTLNGPGGEFVPTDTEAQGHLAPGSTVLGTVADLLDYLRQDPLLLVAALVDPDGVPAQFAAWASGVVSELYVREGVEAFASLALDEI